MKYLILIISLLITAHKFPQHKTTSRYRVNKSNNDTSRYAIFKLNDDPNVFDKNDKPATLSEHEIKQIENLISTEVDKINEDQKKMGHFKSGYIRHPEQYYKQIIPFINTHGEKGVWVNCLCSVSNESDWRSRLIGVLDGGSCYFQLKINLTKNILYDLTINGAG